MPTPISILEVSHLTPKQERATAAIQTIEETRPSPKTPGHLKFLELDLNNLESVKRAAATFREQESTLHVLWNNAGTGTNMVDPGSKTAQGFETMVGMHCIATLLFTKLLLPCLKNNAAMETQSPRVVWTSSFLAEGASPQNGIDFDSLAEGTKDRTRSYAVSKAGTWMLCRECARRYGDDGIVSVVQNPGNLKAGSYAGTPAMIMYLITPLLHDAKFGVYTELYAGLSSDISLETNGAYVIPWGRIREDKLCPRKDIVKAMTPIEKGGLGYAAKFWDWCEEQYRPYL